MTLDSKLIDCNPKKYARVLLLYPCTVAYPLCATFILMLNSLILYKTYYQEFEEPAISRGGSRGKMRCTHEKSLKCLKM